jgi:hypothetical protein
VDVSLSGRSELRLVVTDAGDGIAHDHGDWADAKITCGGTEPADTTAPTVATVDPAAGATDVAVGANVTATFSEAMQAGSISGTSVTLTPAGSTTAVGAAVTYDGATRRAILDPASALAPSTQYTATVRGGTAGVKDVAGNALAADRTWTFTTAASAPTDTTPPTVTAVDPASGATSVSVDADVVATFSEAMQASSISGSTVTLTAAGSTTPVAGTVSYDATTRRATLNPTSALAASTQYTATVRGGTAGVKDVAGNALAADRTWTFTTAAPTAGTTTHLSDRTWTSMTNGWGPVEKDRANGGQAAGDGPALILAGVTYAKGLGAHAASDIRYAINGACSRLTGLVGVDDSRGSLGSVVFQVWGDSTLLYDSGTMTGSSATKSFDVSLTGRTTLRLVVTAAGNGVDHDHADWANPRITCG